VIGYAVDIRMRIVDTVKRELNLFSLSIETSPVTSSNRIPLLMNGTVDPVCSSTTSNAERQRQVDQGFNNGRYSQTALTLIRQVGRSLIPWLPI
jgi:ABC-type amino acid transport substrate-binding protein